MRLTDTLIVVTGSASGLGLATVQKLNAEGAVIAAIDRNSSPALEKLEARFVRADISDLEAVRTAFDDIATLGDIRGLVHCAGRGGDRTRVLDRGGAPSDVSTFRNVIETNLLGTYFVLQAAASKMSTNESVGGERGTIVLTSSVAAFDGQIGQTAYAGAKGAVHSMTLVAARDLAAWQIRVNTIAPGVFETPMLGRFEPKVADALAANVPFPKRLGQPADFAHLAVTLLTNPYVNGETIRLDGALRMAPK